MSKPVKRKKRSTSSAGSDVKYEDKIEALKKIDLFSSMTSVELHKLREKIIIKNFRKNDRILHAENTSDFMYMILDGEAKVVQTTEKGKEILISMHQTGDFFGELSLIDGKTVPADVFATKNSITAIISKNDFFTILSTQPKVLDNLLRILCARLRDSLKKIQLLNFNNASQRIKMLFMILSENYGKTTSEGTVLTIKLIHQNIADMTGLTRETVTRILDKWQKNGEIIILQNRHILLRPEFESISF